MSMSAANDSNRTSTSCSHRSADPDNLAVHTDRVRCLECFRAERERGAQDRDVDPPVILQSPLRSELTDQQISHRRRMLAFALMQGGHAASR